MSQGQISIFHVTNLSEFTKSRTGLDEDKMIGNIGESIEDVNPNWTQSTIFKNYEDDDYSLSESANSSIKTGGLEITSSVIQNFIDEISISYEASNTEIADWLATDMENKNRTSSHWSMGALQY